MPIFSGNINSKAAAVGDDDRIETIISTDNSSYQGQLILDSKLNEAPFDSTNSAVMEGYSITPAVDSHNQVLGSVYSVNGFTLDANTSVFLWIYFPDSPITNRYSLEIGFSNTSGNKISWHFSFEDLYSLLTETIYANAFGWKKIELVYLDAEKNYTDNVEMSFSNMTISYKNELGITDYNTSGTLTFYDVYTAVRTCDKTAVIRNLDYYYYSFNPNFIGSLKNVYTGNKYEVSSVQNVFSYIYVGKNNLALSGPQNNNFSWVITVSPMGEAQYEIGFRDTIYFDYEGSCAISFKLLETKNKNTRTVFTATHTVYVSKYSFGTFVNSSTKIDKKSSLVVQFNMSSDYNASTTVEFKIEDEKVAKIEKVDYNSQLGTYYIQIKGLKKGTTNLVATSTGGKVGDENVSEFAEEMEISIKNSGISESMLITLYIFLGLYGAAFVIFIVISLVNSRRNIVK